MHSWWVGDEGKPEVCGAGRGPPAGGGAVVSAWPQSPPVILRGAEMTGGRGASRVWRGDLADTG